MHSIIYQVADHHIYEEDFLDFENITEGDAVSIGYSYKTEDALRERNIRDLVECYLPKGMFSVNPDLTITYNGGFPEWRKSYLSLLKERTAAITEGTIMEYVGPVYQLEKAMYNPLNIDRLFVTDYTDGMGIAEQSREFMRFVMKLKPGAVIHIGAIIGFHN